MKCEICKKPFNSFKTLSYHIKAEHNYSKKDYYDKYLKRDIKDGICLNFGNVPECKKYTKFQNISTGYSKYCCHKCSMNSKEIKEKTKKTNLNKYGYEYGFQSKEIKEKIKKTNLNKYGYDNPMKSDIIKNKSMKTNLDKYGTYSSLSSKEIRKKLSLTKLKKRIPEVIKYLKSLNLVLLSEYKNNLIPILVKCLKCNLEFHSKYYNLRQNCGLCPKCFPKRKESKGEKELLQFVKSLIPFLIIQENSRNLLKDEKDHRKNQELDVYIPNLKLAFEFNGLYYHSEQFKCGKEYHLYKTLKCEKIGIRLIHIFEDEWFHNKKGIKKVLRKIVKEDWDLLPDYDFHSISLNRRFCKKPEYYENLGFKIKIENPKFKLNSENSRVWNCGFLTLSKKKNKIN